MKTSYWKEKWEVGDIGFHQSEVEPLLIEYFSSLMPGRVLVPLCGKSKDMKWLLDQGWTVTGVEASPIACKGFFNENGLAFEESEQDGKKVFSGKNIKIFCCDFLSTTAKDLGDFDALYDRGALIALPQDMRSGYARHATELLLSSLKGEEKTYLLLALEYPQKGVQGPPFSVLESEVRQLYEGKLKVQIYIREQDVYLPANNRKFAGLNVFETIYLMVPA